MGSILRDWIPRVARATTISSSRLKYLVRISESRKCRSYDVCAIDCCSYGTGGGARFISSSKTAVTNIVIKDNAQNALDPHNRMMKTGQEIAMASANKTRYLFRSIAVSMQIKIGMIIALRS